MNTIDIDVIQDLGVNALILLNEIPLNSNEFLPTLSKLSQGIDMDSLVPLLHHETDNLRKMLLKVDGANVEV